MTLNIILDTDIGTDVDDCLALALLLNSPEGRLAGITCVYGDVLLRARIVLKLLALHGAEDVPVLAGASKPLLGLREVYWEGHEGEGIIEPGDESRHPQAAFAPDFIAQQVMNQPGQIHLVAIGPLTNIALAFLKEPNLAGSLAHLTIMGGVVRGVDGLHLPYAEHNIRCDPEAAHIVFSSGAPITLVPLNITTQVRITRDGLVRLRAAGTAFHDAVAGQLERYPRFRSLGWTNTHDPLAVASFLQPALVTTQPVHIDIETEGRHAAGMTLVRESPESSTRIVTGVDVDAFETFLISRLEQRL
jgi:purine nucleosidase